MKRPAPGDRPQPWLAPRIAGSWKVQVTQYPVP